MCPRTTFDNHLYSIKLLAADFAAILQLKSLFVMTGSQTPEPAPPQQSTTNQLPQSQSQSQQNGPDLSNLTPGLQQQFDNVQNAHLETLSLQILVQYRWHGSATSAPVAIHTNI